MLPLCLAEVGKRKTVQKVAGSPEIRKHLENLGFVTGGDVTVVTAISENLIVNVKNTRVALSRELARKIMISEDQREI